MNKLFSLTAFLLFSTGCFAQIIGKVDKKTKEFSIASNQKIEYTVFGYQFASPTAPQVICFASNDGVVHANSTLKLGAYFDTDRLNPGDKIVYLGVAGTFGKMNFMSGSGKSTIFYLPKSSFVMK